MSENIRDAGVAVSCHFDQLLHEKSPLTRALFPSGLRPGLRILELGTGCGMVGIALAHVLQDATVLVTDLPEVKEIIQRNLSLVETAPGSSIRFEELDWDSVLPSNLTADATSFDLVLAADCTYNPDSRYASQSRRHFWPLYAYTTLVARHLSIPSHDWFISPHPV